MGWAKFEGPLSMDESADTLSNADLAYGRQTMAAALRDRPEKRDRVTWDNGISRRRQSHECSRR